MLDGVEHLRPAVAQVGLESVRHAGDAADVGGHGQGEAVQGAGGREIWALIKILWERRSSNKPKQLKSYWRL